MKGIKDKPEKQEQILARIKASECLVCGTPGMLRRGLCACCYCWFRRRLAGRSKTQRVTFERRAIREGLILDVQQVRAIRDDDSFAGL